MKKTLSLLAVLAVAGVASAPVSAEASTRYVSALAGVTWYNDAEANLIVTSPDFLPNPLISLPMDSGLTGVAALGCDYGDFRVEAELGYQRNSFENSLVGEGFSFNNGEDSIEISSFDSHVDIYSMMANGFYDIPLGGGVELYAMAGVGIAQVNINAEAGIDVYELVSGSSAPVESLVDSFTVAVDTHETTLAYQLGAGLAIPVSKGVKLDARYRYFATTDFNLNALVNVDNLSSHSAMLGLRVDL